MERRVHGGPGHNAWRCCSQAPRPRSSHHHHDLLTPPPPPPPHTTTTTTSSHHHHHLLTPPSPPPPHTTTSTSPHHHHLLTPPQEDTADGVFVEGLSEHVVNSGERCLQATLYLCHAAPCVANRAHTTRGPAPALLNPLPALLSSPPGPAFLPPVQRDNPQARMEHARCPLAEDQANALIERAVRARHVAATRLNRCAVNGLLGCGRAV